MREEPLGEEVDDQTFETGIQFNIKNCETGELPSIRPSANVENHYISTEPGSKD